MLGWRLQGTMLAFTFLLMPLLGDRNIENRGPVLPAALGRGLLYAAILPSTVQSPSATHRLPGEILPPRSGLVQPVGIILTPLDRARKRVGCSD